MAEKKRRPARTKQPPARVRRTREEATDLILGACTRLIVARGPHGVGLVDVAREAGVSHALVTHYFGTIDALIEAALESHAIVEREALVEMILENPEGGPRAWMERWFRWVNRPAAGRLLAWTFLTGRMTREDFFSRRMRGASKVADAVQLRLASERPDVLLERADVEFVILLLMSATHGYALGKEGYWPSLGVDKPGQKEDRFFFDRLAALVEGAYFGRGGGKAREPSGDH